MSANDFFAEIYQIVKTDYHTEIRLCTILRRHKLGTNAAAQNGTSVLHIIVEKVKKLLICPHVIVMPRYIKKGQDWLSHRDKAFVWKLEKSHFGALLKFKLESKVLHVIGDKINKFFVSPFRWSYKNKRKLIFLQI